MGFFKKAIIPTRAEVLFYSVLSVLLLVAANLSHLVGSAAGVQSLQIGDVFQRQLNNLPHANQVLGRLSLALFWLALGALFYIGLWLVVNTFISAHNEKVFKSGYTHPALARGTDRGSTIMRWLFRLAVLLVGLFYVDRALHFLVPVAFNLFELMLKQWPTARALIAGGMAVIGLALTLYLGPVLLRSLFLRPRVFGQSRPD